MISDKKIEVLKLFTEGRTLYKQKNFSLALERFKGALTIDSQDGPSQVFYTRCEHYMKEPPSEDWDGVFEMKIK